MEVDEIIEQKVLNIIRKHLDDPNLTNFEKLDKVLLTGGSLDRARGIIINMCSPIAIHIIKQITYPSVNDWSKEIANKFLNEYVQLEYKTKKWHLISRQFLLKEMVNSRIVQKINKFFRQANRDVEEGAKRKGNKVPEIENPISSKEFKKVWKSFCECISGKLDHDKDFEKEDVRSCLEYAVKEAGLKIKFIWE